jgi:hypothetical protein
MAETIGTPMACGISNKRLFNNVVTIDSEKITVIACKKSTLPMQTVFLYLSIVISC